MEPIARRDDAVLRYCRETDLDAVDAIAIACWTPIFASYEEMFGPVMYEQFHGRRDWRQQKCAQIRDHFRQVPEQIWVVERGRETIAFVTFIFKSEQSLVQIGNNGVRPDQAGQGWGTFMYRHVLDHCRDRGIRFATVGTGLDVGHAPARRAYEAVGFNHAVPKVDYWMDLSENRPGSTARET